MSSMPDVVVLCGGAGLRLRSVTGDSPKAMAAIGGRPFLEWLLSNLNRSGFRRVILATGYRAGNIRSFFGSRYRDLTLEYSEEPQPLGTGGALRLAGDLVTSDAALVTNGDSYTDADLTEFVRDFEATRPEISVLVVPADGRSDAGAVTVSNNSRLELFSEKNSTEQSRFLNAGVYLLSRRSLMEIPDGVAISIEHDLFPGWLGRGTPVRAFVHPGRCLDIGTPERFVDAEKVLGSLQGTFFGEREGN